MRYKLILFIADKIYQRYARNPSGYPTLELKGEMPEFDESLYVPILPNKGTFQLFFQSSGLIRLQSTLKMTKKNIDF